MKTYLPIFTGFYNTFFSIYLEDKIEDELEHLNKEYDDINFNYKEYENEVSINCCDIVSQYLKDEGFDNTIKFESLYSPKYYNYSNDSINIDIDIDLNQIKDFLKDNKEAFNQYIKERYTSCSGFISHHSNNYKDWINELNENEEHKIGACLEFILIELGYNSEDLAYKSSECVYLDYEIIE